jgi:hypothetical protein
VVHLPHDGRMTCERKITVFAADEKLAVGFCSVHRWNVGTDVFGVMGRIGSFAELIAASRRQTVIFDFDIRASSAAGEREVWPHI